MNHVRIFDQWRSFGAARESHLFNPTWSRNVYGTRDPPIGHVTFLDHSCDPLRAASVCLPQAGFVRYLQGVPQKVSDSKSKAR